jgi:3-hydroxyisobutyrate dehydrogenase-like beta-hydroxyacid dehydrogenase
MELGLIGLGLMGRAIASRLIQAGFEVTGYDLDGTARDNAGSLGVNVQVDARSVAIRARVIILSLFSSDNRRDLLWGAQSLAGAIQPQSVILDTTTGKPEDLEEDGRSLAAAGIKLVDVCLSGSSQVMSEGRAIALIGDSEENASYRDVIEALSKAQYYFQTPGQGNRVKLIVNLVFGLNRLVLAEALGLAERAGFDLNTILDILKSGETYSVAMDTKGPKMIAGVYEPAVARLGQHAKDVHLILDYARQLGAGVPVTETHAQVIDELVREGFGDLDNAAIFKAYHS